MKFAICNELFENWPWERTCEFVGGIGYDGIEVAPFTLAPSVTDVPPDRRAALRRVAERAKLEVVGLHWLLVSPTGLYINTPDDALRARTAQYLAELVDFCADLGGKIMVLGSPKQRSIVEGQTKKGAWQRAVDLLSSVLDKAGELGLTICLEPLSPVETNFINTVAEGMKMVRQINHPNFKIHLDVKAMCSESKPVPDIIRSVRAADIGHFHVNDPNLYGPGMGEVDYGPIAEAIKDVGYDKWLSVEVFKYDPDPETIVRKSIDYLRQFWNG